MSGIIHIESITQLHQIMGYPKPAHPLISMVNLAEVAMKTAKYKKIACALYAISLKTKYIALPIQYGRSYFDFEEGVLLGMSPGQVFGVEENIKAGDMEGWALYFHPDLIQGYVLQDHIATFGFFDYETNEALHLSEKEKDTLNSIAKIIKEESEVNIDAYSSDLLVSNLELLMNYIKRYYGRQFITRKSVNTGILSRFEQLMKNYINSDLLQDKGLPTVHYFADALNLSSSYFSDLLKRETGKNAQDHLHNELIRKAKYMLLNSDASVSQIAYGLGFEHAPYFSRLFKKKTGVTPSYFRNSIN